MSYHPNFHIQHYYKKKFGNIKWKWDSTYTQANVLSSEIISLINNTEDRVFINREVLNFLQVTDSLPFTMTAIPESKILEVNIK